MRFLDFLNVVGCLRLQWGCGEGGIRTPGGFHLNGFQDRRNRPLCHLSAAKINFFCYEIFYTQFVD